MGWAWAELGNKILKKSKKCAKRNIWFRGKRRFQVWPSSAQLVLFIIGKGIRHVVFSGPYVFVMNDGSLGKVTCNVHCIEIIVRICRTDRRDA